MFLHTLVLFSSCFIWISCYLKFILAFLLKAILREFRHLSQTAICFCCISFKVNDKVNKQFFFCLLELPRLFHQKFLQLYINFSTYFLLKMFNKEYNFIRCLSLVRLSLSGYKFFLAYFSLILTKFS